MKLRLGIMSAALAIGAQTAIAHEVSASKVEVFVEGSQIEVWQTTPYVIAYDAAATLLGRDQSSDLNQDRDVLSAMASGWRVESEKGDCNVVRQAHRRVHHETQLQFRYLFFCQESAEPQKVSMKWLTKTPSEHFVFFEAQTARGRRTKIVEHGNETVRLEQGLELN